MDIKDIKGVIFDMDGVVLDSMPIWKDFASLYIKSKGLEPEDGINDIVFSMSMEQGIKYFRERYGIKQTEGEIMMEIQDVLRDFYYNEVEAKPGAVELMKKLREAGIRISGATSSPRDHIEHALERNGLLDYMEKLYTSSEVGSSKHDPEIYNMAAAFMGTAPEETLVFEDTLYALKTAKEAGYHTVGVFDPLGESDQEGLKEAAEIYITSPADFLKYFQE